MGKAHKRQLSLRALASDSSLSVFKNTKSDEPAWDSTWKSVLRSLTFFYLV